MTIEDDIARIEAALAAGPTQGPWHQDPKNPYFIARGSAPHSYLVAVAPPTNSGGSQSEIDAAYVAACNPEAILRLVRIAMAAKQMCSALTAMEEEKIDYMRLNKLGDPSAQHTIQMASAAISAYRAAKGQQPREPAAQDPHVLWNGWKPMVLKGNPQMWADCSLDEYKATGPMNRRLVPPSE